MQPVLKKLVCSLLILSVLSAYGQDKSNKGKEFWLGYGHNVLFDIPDGSPTQPPNSQNLVLYISAEQATTVTVSISSTGWTKTVNIPAGTVDVSVIIPKSGPEDARIRNEGKFTKGIHIQSTEPIVVYAHQYGVWSSAATMLMPVETYGYTYYSMNYSQISNRPDAHSWFFVVASENNTKLEITPSGTTKNGWLPNQTYTVTLEKGEIWNVFGESVGNTGVDLTGSKVVSVAGADGNCHPVAMFSGSSRIVICDGNGGEVVQQQIFPANAWGTRYLTYHSVNNPANNISTPFLNFYRVAVRNPATVVKKNGVVMTGLINNFYYEYQSTSGDYIEADQPVLVSQYFVSENQCGTFGNGLNGDPEMVYLSPIEQGIKQAYFFQASNQAITKNFVNIIFPTVALPSLRIDGVAPLASDILVHPANPAYSIAIKRFFVDGSQQHVSCDSAFVATVYGHGGTESYAYNLGTLVNNLNALSEIKNVNGTAAVDTLTCPKTPIRLFVKLAYHATQIHWKLSQVAGLIPNTDSIVNNPVPIRTEIINGRTYYIYTLQQDFSFANIGTYSIPFTYTSPDIDACNNTETASIKVVVVPGPKADFTFPSPFCSADSVHFTGAASPNGFNLVNYRWSFDDNTTINGVNAVKLFATAGPHDVRYRVYSASGCVGDTTKTVTLTESPVVNLGTDVSTCGNGPIVLDATNTNSTYLWQDGSTNPTFSVTTSGLYWVQVTKTAGGCSKRDSINIILGSFPGFDLGNNRAICEGDTVTLNATVTGAISYLWSTGATTPTIKVYQAGTYWCEVNNGCTQRDDITITAVNPKPFVNLGNDISVCGNTPIPLDATNPNSTYLWQDGTTNPTLTATVSGLYWVQVTNNSSCIKRDSINIQLKPFPVFDLGADRDICQGDTVVLNATVSGTATYQWSTGATTPTIKVFQPGNYWCDVTRQGCVFRDDLTITSIKPSPVVNLGNDVTTVCEGSTVPLNATYPGATYLWQDGSSNPIYNVTAPGTYYVQLDLNGCKRSDTVLVNHKLKPRFNLGSDQVVCPGSPLVLRPTLNPIWQLSWQDGSTSSIFTVTDPGTYSLTATNDCGPTSDNVLVIKGICKVFMPSAFTPNNDGRNDYFKALGTETVTKFDLKIFDRWGNIIFQTTDKAKGWDGRVGGINHAAAVYIYTLQYTDINSPQPQVLKGTFVLLR